MSAEREKEKAEAEKLKRVEWDIVERHFDRWTKRIDEELSLKGFTTDFDLSAKYLEKLSVCQKAMSRYSEHFDALKDVSSIVTWQVERIPPGYTVFKEYLQVQVLAHRSHGLAKPWLMRQERYFLLSIVH